MKKLLYINAIVFITASIQPIHASLVSIESQEDFNKIIESNKPSIIIYSAEWCGACVAIKKPMATVSDNPDFAHITFAKVDIDKNQKLAEQYAIRNVPTIHFMLGQEKKHAMIGVDKPTEEFIGTEIKKVFGTQDNPVAMTQAPAEQPAVAQPSVEQPAVEQPAEAPIQKEESSASFMNILYDLFNGIICVLGMITNAIIDGITKIKDFFTGN